MSIEAIQVLNEEIEILKGLSRGIAKKKSPIQKAYADKMSGVEKEIKVLLHNAGVLEEHDALRKKKADLKDEMNKVLEDIDSKIKQASDIAHYLNSRIEALKASLKASQEG